MPFLKSPNDRRRYKEVKLSNGLQVLLISDKETSTTSAAMSVSVGSIDDEVPGLAHFLEHMLFMGSEKYPDEKHYHTYISKHNGSSNAYTAHDHTCYYFEIPPSSFREALDIFAQFFVEPLLKQDSLSREMKAVDSEHKKNLTSDSWRYHQMQKKQVKHTHPYSGFSTGSLDTLDIPEIRDIVTKFYYKYYSPDKMRLVVISNETIESLEPYVANIFSHVPNRNNIKEVVRKYETPLIVKSALKVVPIKSEDQLRITWQLPTYDKYRRYMPLTFMSHLLGYEGNGSICNYLKHLGLIKALYAGSDTVIGETVLFNVVIELTTDGFRAKDKIVDIIYEFINKIKIGLFTNQFKVLFNEQKYLIYQKYINMTMEDPSEYTQYLSSKWCTSNISPQEIIAASELIETYTDVVSELTKDILTYLTQDNSTIIVGSKNYDGCTTHTEKWYGVNYSESNISNILKEKSDSNLTIDYTQLYLPNSNKYISYNLATAKCQDGAGVTESHKVPTKLDSVIDAWWKYDVSDGSGNVQVFAAIKLPNMQQNIETYISSEIYIKCLLHMLNPELYDCNMANYDVSISHYERDTLLISIFGQPENINNILSLIVNNLINVNFDNKVFELVKNMLRTTYVNYMYLAPYQKTTSVLNKHIINNYFDHHDILLKFNDITYENTKNIMNVLRDKVNIRCLIQGNINKKNSLNILNILETIYKDKINYVTEYPKIVQILEQGKTTSLLKDVENAKETNSVSQMVFIIDYIKLGQTNNWENLISCLSIADAVISKEYFNQLRTIKQLGYIVQSTIRKFGLAEYPVYTYSFLVQSHHTASDELTHETEKFINSMETLFDNISDDEFNEYVNSQIDSLSQPDQNMLENCNFNFNVIMSTTYLFNKKQLLIDAMKKVTKADVVNFITKYITNKNTSASWIVEIKGNKNATV
jgi:insulysin